jgi:hypothetical protein
MADITISLDDDLTSELAQVQALDLDGIVRGRAG